MSINLPGSMQELEVIERTISFDDFEDDASPPPHALPPSTLNGVYPREEAVSISKSNEQLFPASDEEPKR